MKDLTLVLFEDVRTYNLYPFNLLRPSCDLVSGVFSFYERFKTLYPDNRLEILCRPELEDLVLESGRNVFREDELKNAGNYLFINARAVFHQRPRFEPDTCWVVEDSLGYLFVNSGRLDDWKVSDFLSGEALLRTRALGLVEKQIKAKLFNYPWEIINSLNRLIEQDTELLRPQWSSNQPGMIGERISLGEGVRFDPGCILDSRPGPVVIEDGVQITQGSVITGPAWIGPRALIDAGRLHGGVSIGESCRIGGEVEASLVMPFSNKHHAGFLGHAYLGSWVNIGAMATNSDLRNDYGEIKIWLNGREIPTGQIKLGCLIGDHAKLGIGVLVNTGTVIGVGANIWFGGDLIRDEIPCFVWGARKPYTEYRMNRFLENSKIVMERRGQKISNSLRKRIVDLYLETRDQRQGLKN